MSKKINLEKKVTNKEWKNTFVDDKSVKDNVHDKIKYTEIPRFVRPVDIGQKECFYCKEVFEKTTMKSKDGVFICNECVCKGKIYVKTVAKCNGCGENFTCDGNALLGKNKTEIFCDECGGME